MGNKLLESNPTIIGKSESLSKEENRYFNRINTILHNNYHSNLYSDYNLAASLEQKSFEQNHFFNKKNLEDITWLDNINRHLSLVNYKYKNAHWISELKASLSNEIFLYENNYFSNFFYNEYYFTTSSPLEEDNNKGLNDFSLDISNKSLVDLDHTNNNNGFNQLDVTENLGGSYLEMNMDNMDPKDPTFQYKMKRINLKKYVKIFKEHIYNNQHHPINRVVCLFNKYFCKYINSNIENFNKQLKDQFIKDENYEKTIQDFEKEITECLRGFIITVHCSLKLFYSTCINYLCFEEEKDDIINLITSLFFKTGNLYETIFSLYSMAFSHELEELQEKFNDLKNVRPKDLGVEIKFCLDEDTLELQRKILKEKQNEKDQKENEDKKNNNEKKENELFQIKENDEEEKENENENEIIENNIIKTDSNENNMNNPSFINSNDKNFKNYNNNDEEDGYLLEKINDDISIDIKMDAVSAGMIHLRNTINCFNNKKYLFPKIRNKLRDTLAQKDKFILEASGKTPIPFSSAINLLRNLKNFKTPFEKIVILAALNDQITESVSEFWNKMMNYIKNSFLFIEADEMMAIFVFIVIKSQMPEMLVESKIIINFTTPSTRAFNISYNLTLMEASLETISKMKNTKEISNREKQLKEVRKSIVVMATQRLSRLSRMSIPDNPS